MTGGPTRDEPAEALDDHVRRELVEFVRALRRTGASVPANAAPVAARSLVEVGVTDRGRVRTALRATLLSDGDDFEIFDRLFEVFWERLTGDPSVRNPQYPETEPPEGSLAPMGDPSTADAAEVDTTDGDDDPEDRPGESMSTRIGEAFDAATDEADEETVEKAVYSPAGSPTTVEGGPAFGGADLEAAFASLTRSLGELRGRRYRRGEERTDARRALRESVGTGGTVVEVPHEERQRSDVRAVFVVDVSRSVLDAIDRGFLIDVLRQASREWRDVRTFFFDEDLQEVTGSVDAPSALAAMRALEAAETSWGGGTRIGESLERLRSVAPDAVDRRTVVFVVSDGLEMGDVSTLERELSWIARRGKRVFWLNPLGAAKNYEPSARGMAAALPYVDGLFAFAGPADVEEMADQLRRERPGGSVGYEFDSRRAE